MITETEQNPNRNVSTEENKLFLSANKRFLPEFFKIGRAVAEQNSSFSVSDFLHKARFLGMDVPHETLKYLFYLWAKRLVKLGYLEIEENSELLWGFLVFRQVRDIFHFQQIKQDLKIYEFTE